MSSCRRDPERPLFRDSAGGMILEKLVREMSGNGSKCDGLRVHRVFDRFGPRGGVTPYSCMSVISILEGSPSRIYLVLKGELLAKSLRLLCSS